MAGQLIFQLAAILLALCAVCSAKSSPTLNEVCMEDYPDIGWETVQEVRQFIEAFKAQPSACREKFHNSITKLEPVLDQANLNDACGPEMYSAIRHYHTRFISFYVPEADKEYLEMMKQSGTEPIPVALYNFFINFATTVSSICKHSLIEQLDNKFHNGFLISDEEFNMMSKMKDEAARIMGEDYHQSSRRIGHVYFPDKASDTSGDEKLYVQVRFNDVIKKAKDACVKKFKPVYDELFKPVVKLNSLGYYDKLESRKENLQLRFDGRYTRWYNIIQICELLNDVDIIQDTSSVSAAADLMLATESKDRKLVKQVNILTKEEAKELRQRIGESIERHASVEDLGYHAQPIEVAHNPVGFGSVLLAIIPKDRTYVVSKFQKKVSKYINDKTSSISLFRHKIEHKLKTFFAKMRRQIANKDGTAALAKVTRFISGHKYSPAAAAIVLFALLD